MSNERLHYKHVPHSLELPAVRGTHNVRYEIYLWGMWTQSCELVFLFLGARCRLVPVRLFFLRMSGKLIRSE